MKNILTLLTAGTLALTFTACENTETTTTENKDTAVLTTETPAMPPAAPAGESGVMVGGAMMVPSKDIVDNAMNSADHTTLVAAVKAGDLVETLKGAGPFTVFAPTNAAFASIQETVDMLLKPENKSKLQNVLKYHVVSGKMMAADLKDGQELTTVQGEKLKVTVKDGKVMVGDATVTIPDVVSSNGATHVVDKVLVPKKL